ncbi:MAG: putative F420-dependent oxidoreductase, partial [Bacteroidia bacterium]
DFHDLRQLAGRVKQFEAQSFDGLMVAEIAHDPFPALTIAAYESEKLELRTSIALALARNPMSMAYMAHELNALSEGRFTLGMGSQIRAHITRRFCMPWYGPAKQMKEYVEALKAIWDCWYDGKALNYEGEHYQYDLMTPEFVPTNIEYGRPRIAVAAVGPLMTKTVAQVADGIIVHSFCSRKHLQEVVVPSIERHLADAGRNREDFEIQYAPFMATGETEEAIAKAKEEIRYRIGFYGSTPAYRTVLETHGWGDLQTELRALTKENRWQDLGSLVTDEVLEAFTCSGEPVQMAAQMRDWFDGKIDRTTIGSELSPEIVAQQLAVLKY